MKFRLKKKWQRRLGKVLLIPVLLVGAGGVMMISAWNAIGAAPSRDAAAQFNKSPNYENGKFINTIPAKDPPFLTTLKEWLKGGEHTFPDAPVAVMKRTASDFKALPKSGLHVTWLGHSTALVEIDGARLLLDPVWSERISPFSWTGPKRFFPPPIALEDLPALDAVLISHDHFDHLDLHTAVALSKTGARFIVPLGVDARLRSWQVPDNQIEALDWWGEAQVNGVTITATPARHFSGRSLMMADKNETLWAGFSMAGASHRVYYSGDTGMFPGFAEIGERLGPFDVALIEVGAYHKLWADLHLGPEQAVQAAIKVGAKLCMPVHWAGFDLALHSWTEPVERLLISAAQHDLPIAVPRPGQSIDPANPLPIERWWPEIPWQSAQEHPIVSSGL